MPLVGMNAYIGVDAILPALRDGADVIIGGRLADPSMFLAPLMHHFGWPDEDLGRMGAGTLVGHLMECGMQITGGYFADPQFKDVPNLAACGFPIAEVDADGSAVITKLAILELCDDRDREGATSLRSARPCALSDTRRYSRFQQSDGAQRGHRPRTRICGGGKPRPDTLKVTVGFDGGFQGEAGVSYAGPGAQAPGRTGSLNHRGANSHRASVDGRVACRCHRLELAVCNGRASCSRVGRRPSARRIAFA